MRRVTVVDDQVRGVRAVILAFARVHVAVIVVQLEQDALMSIKARIDFVRKSALQRNIIIICVRRTTSPVIATYLPR